MEDITYNQFVADFPQLLQSVTKPTLRKWKERDKVPGKALQNLLSVTKSVTKSPVVTKSVAKPDIEALQSVTKPEPLNLSVTKTLENHGVGAKPVNSVAKLKVLQKSAEAGHPEFDIMSDGYARGFPGDSKRMRQEYRTPHAIRRIVEAAGGSTQDVKRACQVYEMDGKIPALLLMRIS